MIHAQRLTAIKIVLLCTAFAVQADAEEATGAKPPLQSYYPASNWNEPPGVLNMSMHAYYDRNRNGSYDVGERGMAKIAFELHKPDGSRVFSWTNVSGFANFLMGAPPSRSDIATPGTYWFVGIVPPGWQATSGNLRQSRTIVASPGSLTGLAAVDAPVPVGLAPKLTIRGKSSRRARPGTIIRAKGPDGQILIGQTDPAGRFLFEVAPGLWTIEDGSVSRDVRVDFAPVYLSEFRDRPLAVGRAEIRVLHFDDLQATSSLLEIPNGYGGLNWKNWVSVKNDFYGGEGYINGNISGNTVIYNSSGQV
jgi:hypothetical protein